MEAFLQRLQALAPTPEEPQLAAYIKGLQQAIQQFDINAIRDHIQQFPNLVGATEEGTRHDARE